MRIDKFLNVVNITKRRAVALDMCKNGAVLINGVVAKPSKEIKIGDEITLMFLKQAQKFQVLALPSGKNIPKTAKSEYVKEL